MTWSPRNRCGDGTSEDKDDCDSVGDDDDDARDIDVDVDGDDLDSKLDGESRLLGKDMDDDHHRDHRDDEDIRMRLHESARLGLVMRDSDVMADRMESGKKYSMIIFYFIIQIEKILTFKLISASWLIIKIVIDLKYFFM